MRFLYLNCLHSDNGPVNLEYSRQKDDFMWSLRLFIPVIKIHRSTSDRMLNSCVRVNVFDPNIKISISSECFRQYDDIMWLGFQCLISCGPIRVLVSKVNISVASEYFRQKDDFMLSRQTVHPSYKHPCLIGVLPTEC